MSSRITYLNSILRDQQTLPFDPKCKAALAAELSAQGSAMLAWQGLLIAKEQRHPLLWERQWIHSLRDAPEFPGFRVVVRGDDVLLCVRVAVGWRNQLIGNDGSEKSPRIGIYDGHQLQTTEWNDMMIV